jgi:hypothetical protein
MADDLEKRGIEALDRFINTFNSRNAREWSASLNYPHVRPTILRDPHIFENLEEHASIINWQQALNMGWDHSTWDNKNIIHTSENKIHASGQYTRYTKEGDTIWANEVMYIITRIGDQWGIQARFGIDQVAEKKPDIDAVESIARDTVQKLITATNGKDREKIADLMNYTFIEVDPGDIRSCKSIEDFLEDASCVLLQTSENCTRSELISLQMIQYSKVSLNIAVEIDHLDLDDTKISKSKAVYLLTLKEGKWGIQAGSVIRA